MSANLPLMMTAFFMAASLAGVVGLLLVDRNRRLKARLLSLTGRGEADHSTSTSAPPTASITRVVQKAIPRIGETIIPDDDDERTLLKTRLIRAGLYKPQAMVVFLGVKLVLTISPFLVGLAAGIVGLIPITYGLLFGACASILGTIGPSFWLDRRASQRQMLLRRALPDACDLIVICMEGGLSLSGALRRVVGELRTAHPLLAEELNIVQRKAQLGEPLGNALANFAKRTDVAEIQTLSSVVNSAEKFGSSMVKALQNYSQSLRLQRQQRAEEMAQKASTKVLFPTLIFIFPSILIIILGPAAIQLVEVIRNMQH